MNNKEIIVVLDNVRSVLNVGAILRTSDGAHIKKLYLCGITPTVDHPKIKKTALGAEEYVETEHIRNPLEVVKRYKDKGYQIISIEQVQGKSQLYQNYNFSDKVCLVFGNEISGVSTELLEESDAILELPMLGKKNSLNVATTVGIILYHIITK